MDGGSGNGADFSGFDTQPLNETIKISPVSRLLLQFDIFGLAPLVTVTFFTEQDPGEAINLATPVRVVRSGPSITSIVAGRGLP